MRALWRILWLLAVGIAAVNILNGVEGGMWFSLVVGILLAVELVVTARATWLSTGLPCWIGWHRWRWRCIGVEPAAGGVYDRQCLDCDAFAHRDTGMPPDRAYEEVAEDLLSGIRPRVRP